LPHDGTYTGHRKVNERGYKEVHDDDKHHTLYARLSIADTSFERVEDVANTPGKVDVSDGENKNLRMHYSNVHFCHDHVCKFVLTSPVDGWVVSFKNEFTPASMRMNTH
jgi:hypothetical protein